MIPKKVYDLCHGSATISSELAHNPTLAPGEARKKIYGTQEGHVNEHKHFQISSTSQQDIQQAYECGNWGPTRPSELFLKVKRAYGLNR